MNPYLAKTLNEARSRAQLFSTIVPAKFTVYLFRPIGSDNYVAAALGINLVDGPWVLDGFIGEPLESYEACESRQA